MRYLDQYYSYSTAGHRLRREDTVGDYLKALAGFLLMEASFVNRHYRIGRS